MNVSIKLDILKIILIVTLTPLFPAILGNNLGGLIALVVPLVIIFLLPFRKISENYRAIGFKRPDKTISFIAKAIILGLIVSFFFKTCIEPLLELGLGEKRDLSSFYELKGNTNLLLVYVVRLILIAGFYEEIVFRGYLFNALDRIFSFKHSTVISILISSLIFSLFHVYQGLIGVLYTFFAGATFCFFYLRFQRNIWSIIIIHAVFDISSAILVYFDKYDYLNSLLFSF